MRDDFAMYGHMDRMTPARECVIWPTWQINSVPDAKPLDLQILPQVYSPPSVGVVDGRITRGRVAVHSDIWSGIVGFVFHVTIHWPRGLISSEDFIEVYGNCNHGVYI